MGRKKKAKENNPYWQSCFEYRRNGYIREEQKRSAEELKRIGAETEDALGLTGTAIEGETRRDLMIFIGLLLKDHQSFYSQIEESSMDFAALRNQVSELKQAYEERIQALEEERRAMLLIIGQYKKAQEQAEQLQKEKEAKKKAASEKKKTAAELFQEILEREARAQKKYEKLQAERELAEENMKSDPEPADPSQDPTPGAGLPVEKPSVPGDKDSEEPVRDASVPSAGTEEPSRPAEEDEKDVKIRQLEEDNAVLKGEVEVLTFRANQDFQTSSRPSRTRDYGDPKTTHPAFQDAAEASGQSSPCNAETAMEEEKAACMAALHDSQKSPNVKSGGGRGKPPGSAGGGRTIPDRVDERRTVACSPEACMHCQYREKCAALNNAREQAEKDPDPHGPKIYDLIPRTILETYVSLNVDCPVHGRKLKGKYPEEVTSSFQYGECIRTLCVTLSTVGMMSYRKIADIVGAFIGDSKLSASAIVTWVKETARLLDPTMDRIMAAASMEDYLHSDETGIRIKGVLHWIHAACTEDYTYMRVHRKRGKKAMNEIGILPFYEGTLITDCWASYWGYCVKHCLCNAHLLRELYALVKFFSKDREWAQEAMDLLREMDRERDRLIARGTDHFEPEVLDSFLKRYDAIVEKGLALHPDIQGRRKNAAKGKARCLLDRMKKYKDSFLRFLFDFKAPFTNNLAEANMRPVAAKRGVVGCFDTIGGADDFVLIWSYVVTSCKHGANPYDAICAAIRGEASDLLFTPEEAEALDRKAAELKEKKFILLDEEMKREEAEVKAKIRNMEDKREKRQVQEDQAKERLDKARRKYQEAEERHAQAKRNADAAAVYALKVHFFSLVHEFPGTEQDEKEEAKELVKAARAADSSQEALLKADEAREKARASMEKAEAALKKKTETLQKTDLILQKLKSGDIDDEDDQESSEEIA